MLCEVLRDVTGPGGVKYPAGSKVQVSEWRWAKQLILQRKLRPINADEASTPEIEAEAAFPRKQRGRPRKEEK